ncbi:hypothetical protein U8326_05225 [Tsuneonella sp. CC-YZS046]|uniref:hypothetical protein n=1 Tax=Tsuneonella sp. CC-YZS046 TaxID=3042152 RepID=UPI002D78B308|nr:hypothetical protein [Tsuneonella sp. CC-YZS046]WRO67564.1 hypothetical protein U8326_05225 [Tsuneonella sp. CC-YZS046]
MRPTVSSLRRGWRGNPAIVLPLAVCACSAGGPIVEVVGRQYDDYQADRYEAPSTDGDVIHAIGIYEGGSDHGPGLHPREDVTVEIDDQGDRPVYLALSSYEPVRWNITGPGAGAVKGVYLAGYHSQQVVGAKNARVVDRSAERGGDRDREEPHDGGWGVETALYSYAPVSCTYTYATLSGGGCASARQFLTNARALFGAQVASFTGIYNAQHFRIR